MRRKGTVTDIQIFCLTEGEDDRTVGIGRALWTIRSTYSDSLDGNSDAI